MIRTDDASSNGAIPGQMFVGVRFTSLVGFTQEFLDRQAKAYTYADYICEYKSSLGRPSYVSDAVRYAVF